MAQHLTVFNTELIDELQKSLPHGGVIYPSKNPQFHETIVFIHHYGGNHRSNLRHVHFVNELGYHAASLSLSFNSGTLPQRIPWNSQFEIGYAHVWKEEIESLLNHIPGKKILFGFSNPGGAMLLAAARRNYIDISSVICDGGPFLNSAKMILPVLASSKEQFSWKMKASIVFLNQMIFGKNYNSYAKKALNSVPSNVPFLSIRSWKDQLVPSHIIDEYFSYNPSIDLEVLSLTEGDHLQGIKSCPEEYKDRVSRFLKKTSSTL